MAVYTPLSMKISAMVQEARTRGDAPEAVPLAIVRATGIALWEAERSCVRHGLLSQQAVDGMRAERKRARA